MFLSKPKTIIAFENHKLRASKVSIRKDGPVVEEEIEKELVPGTLAETLIEIKKELKTSSARILLPEEKTYLKLLEFPRNLGITRDTVLQKAREVIPETLEEGYFDWKQAWMGPPRRSEVDPPTGETGKKNFKVQVLAVSKDYLVSIQQTAQKARLTLEAFEPPSFALARLTSQEGEPHLIVYKGAKTIICAAYEGRAFGVVTVDKESQVGQKSKELTEFVKEKWGLKIQKTISQDLNPAIGLALKEDIKGKDEKVLNLAPPKVEQSPKNPQIPKPPRSSQSPEEKAIEKESGDSLSSEVARRDSSDGGTASEDKSSEEEKAEKLEVEGEESETSQEETPDSSPEIFEENLSRWEKIRELLFNKKTALIASISILILGLVAGGVLIYQRTIGKKESESSLPQSSQISQITPTESAIEFLEPSPTSEPKREDLKIQVLNGRGVAGTAGEAKEFLESLGYKEIEIDNASSYDYQETEISIKESKRDYLNLLKEDLSEKYTLSTQTPYVDKDSQFDVILTIGQK